MDGSGGAETGGAGSGGGPAAGGTGGTGGTPECDGVFDPAAGECGECVVPMEDHCAEFACAMPDDLSCQSDGLHFRRTSRGCGYVELYGEGDVGWPPNSARYIWLEATGELVFHYLTPSQPVNGCLPSKRVGVAPECDAWELSCDGAGGMGGGP